MLGILGQKVGMTRQFTENGESIAVTVVTAGPCIVLQKRTLEKEGYLALQVGFGKVGHRSTKDETAMKRMGKPLAGLFQKAGAAPQRWIREFRVTPEEAAKYEIGGRIDAGLFQKGAVVDVAGTSKGRGFAGVVKRHHMAGHVQTHGTHEYFRHPGSIGQRKTPGKVWKNKRMPGHMGVERVTVQNLVVVDSIPEKNLLLLQGAVPGANGGLVIVRPAVKRAKAHA